MSEIINEFDEEFALDSFSSDIAIDSILQQIEMIGEEVENSNDLFDIILQKYKFIQNKYKDNSELLSKIDDVVMENAETILNKIQEKLDFQITFSETMLNEDKLHNIHMIYSFFINHIEEGIESLIYNYFKNNIKNFPKRNINKKDLTYISMKTIIDPDYLNQIFYFKDNVETIRNINIVSEDIIELMITDDPTMFVNFWIDKIFIDNLMCDINFGDKFVNNLIEIALDVSDKIFRVYNKVCKEFTVED